LSDCSALSIDVDKKVHKPGEQVLVHRFDVGQISDGEEEDGGLDCNCQSSALLLLLWPTKAEGGSGRRSERNYEGRVERQE